ncbi:hypothetical protein CEXT_348821 [Caerostris extrusa]|uniref:Uncharacterized protein n=1 Tax=Caerostris extrusa TaxID=172846 RepID=A0AAV4XRI3_CAEEX|nr:hypothetical protein CEXT_348821 [Caerostris extrusa]
MFIKSDDVGQESIVGKYLQSMGGNLDVEKGLNLDIIIKGWTHERIPFTLQQVEYQESIVGKFLKSISFVLVGSNLDNDKDLKMEMIILLTKDIKISDRQKWGMSTEAIDKEANAINHENYYLSYRDDNINGAWVRRGGGYRVESNRLSGDKVAIAHTPSSSCRQMARASICSVF